MQFTRLSDHLLVAKYGDPATVVIIYFVPTWNEWRVSFDNIEQFGQVFSNLQDAVKFIQDYSRHWD